MDRCRDQSGFLFAHRCDQPAVTTCGQCGRPICHRHSRPTDAGPRCASCAKAAFRDHERDDDGIADDPFLYTNRFYASSYIWDEHDAGAFEREPGVLAEQFEDRWDAT